MNTFETGFGNQEFTIPPVKHGLMPQVCIPVLALTRLQLSHGTGRSRWQRRLGCILRAVEGAVLLLEKVVRARIWIGLHQISDGPPLL